MVSPIIMNKDSIAPNKSHEQIFFNSWKPNTVLYEITAFYEIAKSAKLSQDLSNGDQTAAT